MSKIENIGGTEFDELLQQVHFGKHDVDYSHIIEWQDMSEELLGVVSAPASDRSSTSGMAPRDGSCHEPCSWMD